ncbi:MAG TPA: DNA alkylation repair protein [Anaerolineales bacterium]|nr:DNA alkylation repair protein [Anaerolineales bacterium]
METAGEVMQQLRSKSKPDQLEGMARFAIVGDQRMGVSVPDMRNLAKEIGKNHQLALDLWDTGVPEGMIVAGMIAEPEKLTERQMEAWVVDINSWDICDQVCMNLFEKTPLAEKKIYDWSVREEEFVKRAAYALIACLAWHDKGASDEAFTQYFPLIVAGATDDRNFVKKAVNWALRNIGKRNQSLNEKAIQVAHQIQGMDAKSARWIASNALRELESDKVQERLRKQGK